MRLALVPFLAILAGCQFSENRYLTRPVKSSELVGSWRATEFAIKSLRDVGVREHLTVQEHTLVLESDGSCSVKTVMNMLEAADYRTSPRPVVDGGSAARLDARHSNSS